MHSPITVSLVDSWPSTVMRLNDRATASCSRPAQSSSETTASQVTKHSIVAMLGLIMPQPLAANPSLTLPSGSATCRAPYLACLSVVRMAEAKWSAALASPPPGRAAAAAAMPGSILSMGNCTPMSPVEHTPTCSTGSRRWLAVSSRMRAASASPCLPVTALALPALTTTARRWRAVAGLAREPHRGGGGGVARERRRRDRRLLAEQQGEVELAALLDAAGDAGGQEPLGGGQAAAGLLGELGQRSEPALGQHVRPALRARGARA